MKKTLLHSIASGICLAVACNTLSAQPVLVNTMMPFPVGTNDSIYAAAATVSPGAGGAGVTWDLSGLTPLLQGTISIVNPSSTPYFSTFPSATFCAKENPTGGGSAYIYERLSATKWEQLSNNYAGVGTGTDYTPNPESAVEFPMHYLDSFTDTFQKVGGSANTVNITYDGYGTLKTPFATYTNVVRIYKYWGPGDYDYNWYVTSPYLNIVMSFDMQSSSYTLVRDAASTSVINIQSPETVEVYPNPVTDNAIIKIATVNGINNASISLTNSMGAVLREIPLKDSETILSKGNLPGGLYFYSVFNNGMKIATGKLIIQ